MPNPNELAPLTVTPGALRFNTDSAKLEYFDSLQWLEMEAFNNELGGGTGSNTGLGNRGVFGGGYAPGDQNTIDFITISTLGNAQDFGDLSTSKRQGGACSSSIRGIFAGGLTPTPSNLNVIEFVTIASTGDAIDFGDLTQARMSVSGLSNQTRGVFTGGYIAPAGVNTIDFITISTIGNASDFGDLSQLKGYTGACSDAHGGLGD